MYVGLLGTVGTGEQAFLKNVEAATKALAALVVYAEQLKKKAEGWFVSDEREAQLLLLSEVVQRYAEQSGPALLKRAIDEGSFDKLRQLQTGIRNVTANALSELEQPSQVREFLSTVIVGSVVDLGQGVREALKTAKDATTAVSSNLPWVAGAVGLVALAVIVSRLPKKRG
jgi:hypothetical protein